MLSFQNISIATESPTGQCFSMSSAVPEAIFLTREHLAIYGHIFGGRSRGGDGADGCYTSCNAQESFHHEELHPKVSAVLGLRNCTLQGGKTPVAPSSAAAGILKQLLLPRF